MHTDWSDGHASIADMAEKATQMGLEYITVTDHTKALGIAKGLDEERLMKQMAEVRRVDEEHPEIRVLAGTECDIRRDGRLDISDEVLAELDWVVAAVHSGFKMEEQAMTSRVVEAMQNEHVDTVAHPTGRLIQRRSPYALDLDAVFEAAAERGVMMEINCYPDRLDLSDVNSRRAREHGVKMTLGTDAHSPSELEFLPLGVSVARRGWLEAADVANTLTVEELLKHKKG
jgi:DNA polymerase (family 10)